MAPLALLPLLLTQAGPQSFKVDNAALKYRIDIKVKPGPESSDYPIVGPGSVTLTHRASGITQKFALNSVCVFSEHLCFSVEAKAKSPSPYAETATVVFQDFDFDGIQDLAICNDTEGAYNGPPYTVYRWVANQGKFVRSADLTRLSSEFTGLVAVDAKARQLFNFAKSGAAFHKTSYFSWMSGKLVLVKVEEEDASGSKVVITTKTKIGNRWKTTKRTEPHSN